MIRKTACSTTDVAQPFRAVGGSTSSSASASSSASFGRGPNFDGAAATGTAAGDLALRARVDGLDARGGGPATGRPAAGASVPS